MKNEAPCVAKPDKTAPAESYPTYCGKRKPISETVGKWAEGPICKDCETAILYDPEA